MMRRGCSLALCLTALAACHGDARHGAVHLELAALLAQARLSGFDLAALNLRISAADLEVIEVALPLDADGFELDVPAGLARRFELDARTQRPDGLLVPVYYGLAVADVVARSELDLAVPVWPAGFVRASLSASGAALPDELAVRLVARAPANGRPETVTFLARGGALEGVLTTGTYDLEARTELAGVLYELRPTPIVSVAQGALAELGALVLLPPDATVVPPPSGAPVGGPGSGLGGSPNVALTSPSYSVRFGALGSAPRTVLASPSYRLLPALKPAQRSSP